jgi:protein-S-isoprenylcysteine O-methyltransferase Ste14
MATQAGGQPASPVSLCEFLVEERVAVTFTLVAWFLVQNLLPRGGRHDPANFCDALVIVAVALILAGLGLRTWAAGVLQKGKALATSGPYQLCRHPLYLGSLLIMAGFYLLLPDVRDAWTVVGPAALVYALTIRREESRLARRYGATWEAYAAAVPRFLPRHRPDHLRAKWSLAQWARSREYNAVLASLLGLVGLKLWLASRLFLPAR